MRQLTTWVLSAVLFAGVGGFSAWMLLENGQREAEGEVTEATTRPASEEVPAVSRDENGAVVVHMDPETQDKIGLKVEPAATAKHEPTVVAFGTVQENPAGTFTVRAPMAGTLVAGKSGEWVRFGEQVKADAEIGGVAPRFGPVEQADMKARLATARAEEQEARASLDAAKTSLESKRSLNAQNKIVSDQALQDAQAKVKGDEARLKAAQETVHVLSASLGEASHRAEAMPLKAAKSGRVVEVLAQPGEAVDSGQALVRLANYDRLFARVALPTRQLAPTVVSAIVKVDGFEDKPLPAEVVSPAAAADSLTGGRTLVLAFSPGDLPIQPGLPVEAELRLDGKPIDGVTVPTAALVRYVGAIWAYVKTADASFTRRELPDAQLTPSGCFVPGEALKAGESVVVQAAQSLLSQELKFQTGGGGEEEE